MTKFSDISWTKIEPIYSGILTHPFVTELADATLPEEKFIYYINQDALYLSDFGKALSIIAGRLHEPSHIKAFMEFSKDTVAVEQALHETFLKGAHRTRQSPSCLFYTSYILKHAMLSSVEAAVAAVLPCFWIYREVGDHIKSMHNPNANPYQSWIDTYGGEEYSAAVGRALSIYNALAENTAESERKRMLDAFLYCSRMEWMFWDSAYRLEEWPV